MVEEPELCFPLPVGSRVELYKDGDFDEQQGVVATVFFSDEVEQYVPETGLLRFENSDAGRAEFHSLVEEADGYRVFTNYD